MHSLQCTEPPINGCTERVWSVDKVYLALMKWLAVATCQSLQHRSEYITTHKLVRVTAGTVLTSSCRFLRPAIQEVIAAELRLVWTSGSRNSLHQRARPVHRAGVDPCAGRCTSRDLWCRDSLLPDVQTSRSSAARLQQVSISKINAGIVSKQLPLQQVQCCSGMLREKCWAYLNAAARTASPMLFRHALCLLMRTASFCDLAS
jgi:hypothetical protein